MQGVIIKNKYYSKKRYHKSKNKDAKAILEGLAILFLIFAVVSIIKFILEHFLMTILLIGFVIILFFAAKYTGSSYPKTKAATLYGTDNFASQIDDNIIDVKQEQNIQKGNDFEEYVVRLFNESDFTIVEWTTDIMRKHNRYVEADTRPDLLLRHNKTRNEFYVECKYRSYAPENKIIWTDYAQLNRYHDIKKESGKPVFVVIGLGGIPKRPDYMFCLPLEEAKYPELYMSYANGFSRAPERSFSWNGTVIY